MLRHFNESGKSSELRWYIKGISHFPFVRGIPVIACCLLLSLLGSCVSPEALKTFADSAQKGLAGGPLLFADMYDACVRRESSRPSLPSLPIFVPPGSSVAAPKEPSTVAACARFDEEAKELTRVSDVLTAYFKAMERLAGFNASTVSAANEMSAENAATAGGLTYTQIMSAGKLANLLTQVATERYQRNHLIRYLREANPEVANITDALDTVAKTYISLLDEEQQTLTARYQSVGDTSQGAVLLLLNRAYSEDLSELHDRRTSADAYREALKNIREGHGKLVENAQHLTAKELNSTLQPYISSIDGAVLLELKKK